MWYKRANMQHLKSSEYQLRCSISFISLFSHKLGHWSQTAELVNLTEFWGVTTKCLIFINFLFHFWSWVLHLGLQPVHNTALHDSVLVQQQELVELVGAVCPRYNNNAQSWSHSCISQAISFKNKIMKIFFDSCCYKATSKITNTSKMCNEMKAALRHVNS